MFPLQKLRDHIEERGYRLNSYGNIELNGYMLTMPVYCSRIGEQRSEFVTWTANYCPERGVTLVHGQYKIVHHEEA
jgi:hypothetical protein